MNCPLTKTITKIKNLICKKSTNIAVVNLHGVIGKGGKLEQGINIENVNIDIKTNKKKLSLIIQAKVESSGKTGVEMEALTAVSVSCLTVYDMCKNLDKSIKIRDIRLIYKSGGKSDFKN